METNRISTKTYLNPFTNRNLYLIEIDGKSLEDIILESQETILKGLVPTLLNWLDDPEERKVVWKRVLPPNGSTTRLPILMCSEDVDFWCTLIMVEVECNDQYVIWKRFGLENSAAEAPDEIGKSVKWFDDISSMCFERDEFEKVVNRFRDNLSDDALYPPDKNEKVEEYKLFNT